MTLSASGVADELDRTSKLLAEHAVGTTQRVHDLALGASSASDFGGASTMAAHENDPTGEAATSPPDRFADLETRWVKALTNLRVEAWPVTGPPHAHARALAAWLRSGGAQPSNTALRRLHGLSVEIDHIIYETIPTDREEAAEELREKHYAATSAECCQACESVTGPSTDPKIPSTRIVSGLCRPGCYDMEKRQEQRGQYIDRATFIDHTRAGVARGEIVRPASPLWRTAVPTIHEGDPAAEWGYSDA